MSALDDGWSFLEPATDRPEARLAVRLAFIVAGGGITCVAALMPSLTHRIGLDLWDLAMAALALLAGALIGARTLTRTRAGGGGRTPEQRPPWLGARRLVLIGGLGSSSMLPVLALAGSPGLLAAALFAFGLCAGALEVAMHATADEVARSTLQRERPGLRTIYGVAGVGGALVTTLLLAVGFEPPLAAALVAAPMAIATVVAWPYVLEAPARRR
ncbi:hypothetical protein [Roseateles noduli]|uniref:hypothetical protein n=1 Tax=Roseateles noduli TaxID=2052484 RepID=UPI003D65EE27